MNLSDFCRCYTNAADHELVKEMLHWFREDTESKTVTANRDTRNDLQNIVIQKKDRGLLAGILKVGF